MPKKIFTTKSAPAAIGPYSQAVEAGGIVFISGQLPIDPTTGEFAGTGIREQARQSLENIKAILCEAGLDLTNVVKVTVFLADISDFSDMNEVYCEYFTADCPARSAIAVAAVPKGARLEIEAIAVR